MTSVPRSTPAAEATYRLAGFLNGTHRGVHTARHRRRFSSRAVHHALRSVEPPVPSALHDDLVLGRDRWTPTADDEVRLRDSLVDALTRNAILECIVFGSLARGSTTGFSDVDAVLVVDDEVALDPRALGRLRTSVFAAGRAVLAYQPLQHHGFVIVTPRLLGHPTALGLPPEVLTTSASLFGKGLEATVTAQASVESFRAYVEALRLVNAWPRHAWDLHRVVAMFELAPALYLQATGRASPKHASFEIARADFPDLWFPYDVLRDVRLRWPRAHAPGLQRLSRILRNPWTASAVRRRIPARIPTSADELLDERCLIGLHRVIGMMSENVG